MNRKRLESDRERLRRLVARAPDLVSVDRELGTPPRHYQLTLRCRGLAAIAQPPRFATEHRLQILLPDDYPLEEPSITIVTPLVHPHVWTNGDVCLGSWRPTEYLDLLVCRLFRIIQMDPAFINKKSPANISALRWAATNMQLLPLGTLEPCSRLAAPAKAKITFERIE